MKPTVLKILMAASLICSFLACGRTGQQTGTVELAVLDPGHFHASLVFKYPIEGVSNTIRVYAPEGPEVGQFLSAVESFNGRQDNPTSWNLEVYLGEDYLEKMLGDRPADVVVLAGNNAKKTRYIHQAVKAGSSVLSDKPMAINKEDFELLAEAYRTAEHNGTVIRDIMTERYDMLNVMAKSLMQDRELFGDVLPGTPDNPAVMMRSVHHFFKTVSGQPLIRPAWYYDVRQQGEGIADVTTHMIDQVSWMCFPEEALSYESDIAVLNATHRPTLLTQEQFRRSTGLENFPAYLDKDVNDGVLEVMANGTITYRAKGIHVGIEVIWDYTSEGGGDTSSSIIRGENATLELVQDKRTGFVRELYIRRSPDFDALDFEKSLEAALEKLADYPIRKIEYRGNDTYFIDIPLEERLGHETHFGLVAADFLKNVREGKLPRWEKQAALSKYYITTTAVGMADGRN